MNKQTERKYRIKKRTFRIAAAMLSVALLSAFLLFPLSCGKTEDTASDCVVIVVDAGHGGEDPGKVSGNLREADINLAVAKKVKAFLTKKGFTVLMSRETSDGLYYEGSAVWTKTDDMKERKHLILNSGASFTVSIHQNSYHDSRVRGAQVFISDCLPENERAASLIQSELKAISRVENTRPVLVNNDLLVLRENPMPSVIVECGFLSNPDEAYLLSTDEYQTEVARAIERGISAYFGL